MYFGSNLMEFMVLAFRKYLVTLMHLGVHIFGGVGNLRCTYQNHPDSQNVA